MAPKAPVRRLIYHDPTEFPCNWQNCSRNGNRLCAIPAQTAHELTMQFTEYFDLVVVDAGHAGLRGPCRLLAHGLEDRTVHMALNRAAVVQSGRRQR